MSKFKVGDKVRIVKSDYSDESGLIAGSVHNVVGTDGFVHCLETNYPNSEKSFLTFEDCELEHYTSRALQVGQTYTSENGSEWECIFIRDGKAWMLGVYPDGASGSAYDFEIDGTASWAGGHGATGYNIKWGAKRETVHTKGNWSRKGMPQPNHYHYNITFDLIDGTPDWTTAKVGSCD